MLAVIGFVVVFGSVVGGYILEHGNLHVLWQPVELLIIGGAALGAFFIGSPPGVIFTTFKSIVTIFGGGPAKAQYLEILTLMNRIFAKIRKEGLVSIEEDVENPHESPMFSQAPGFLKKHHVVTFLCDNLRVIMTTNISPHELEAVMDMELESHHEDAMVPSKAITRVADGLPALGIVAAVLGVVITMGKISEPPEVLGHSIGAALVGTFLGVLLAYGFVGPVGTNLEYKANENSILYHVIKVALVSFVGGSAPQIAVEFGRRVVPGNGRPGFIELEEALRAK